ncbi:MAG: hypothetical protein ACPGSO_01695 [Vicingaceae bacterium]
MVIKNLISTILITLFCSCSLDQSNSIENKADVSNETKSDNKSITLQETDRFEIHSSINQGSDNITEYQYFLIDNELNDSVSFLKSQRHDLPAPNYFWTSSQKMLIYEQDKNNGQQSVIKIIDPENKQTKYETSGFFQGHPNQNSDYLDEESNILFCFTLTESNQKIAIKKIDLDNYNDTTIFEFSCLDIYERPTLKINQTDRLLSFNYSCQEANKTEMTTEKGEIKY